MVLVIACGNSLRRDDGAGPVLAERISGRSRRPDLEIHCCHQLTADLALRLSAPDVSAVLFVDAALDGRERNPALPLLRSIPFGEDGFPLGHHLTPAALLELCTTLYGRRPPAWQVEIPGVDFGFGEGLSPVAREFMVRAEGEIRAFLDMAGSVIEESL